MLLLLVVVPVLSELMLLMKRFGRIQHAVTGKSFDIGLHSSQLSFFCLSRLGLSAVS